MINAFSSLILDQSCYACGRNLIVQENWICFDCLGQIEETHFASCPSDNELYYRLAGKVPLNGAASMYYFDKAGRLQHMIQHIKYKDAMMLARHLGKLYGEVLAREAFCEADTVIVPVPLHWRRRWSRGYNQATEIGKGIAEAMSLPLMEGLIRRKSYTRTQTRLSGQARWQNVAEAFVVSKEPPRKLILLDDVITTGATLEACLRVLHAHKRAPEQISIVSIGMARKN